MAIYCCICGLNLNLVGRAHRCVPRADAEQLIARAVADVNAPVNAANAPSPAVSADATDHNRAADERRAYMREYMRKRRAAAKAARAS